MIFCRKFPIFADLKNSKKIHFELTENEEVYRI